MRLLVSFTTFVLQAKAFAVTKEKFGSVDILVNNAGIADIVDWEKTLLVNLVSSYHARH